MLPDIPSNRFSSRSVYLLVCWFAVSSAQQVKSENRQILSRFSAEATRSLIGSCDFTTLHCCSFKPRLNDAQFSRIVRTRL